MQSHYALLAEFMKELLSILTQALALSCALFLFDFGLLNVFGVFRFMERVEKGTTRIEGSSHHNTVGVSGLGTAVAHNQRILEETVSNRFADIEDAIDANTRSIECSVARYQKTMDVLTQKVQAILNISERQIQERSMAVMNVSSKEAGQFEAMLGFGVTGPGQKQI